MWLTKCNPFSARTSEIQQGTITKEVCCETLRRLHRTFQTKRRAMLSSDIFFFFIHDNAGPHCAKGTEDLEQFMWGSFRHFYLFWDFKAWLGGQLLAANNKLQDTVKTISPHWLTSLRKLATSEREGIKTLVSRYDKCLNRFRDYVEK